jgi:hypothetical protein
MTKRRRGVQRFTPTADDRSRVSTAVAMGLTHAQIAKLIFKENGQPIAERTLRQHFKEELRDGKNAIHVAVAQQIIQRGLTTSDTLLIFYAKCQMGWRDRPPADDAPATADAQAQAQAIRAAVREMDDTVG